MRNIIIIGNGFDLSHNLPSGYSSFIENLILTELNKVNSKLLKKFMSRPISEIVNKTTSDRTVNYVDFNKKTHRIITNNYFLADLLEEKNIKENDWSDIESFYFSALLKTSENNLIKLHEDFEIIKKKLIAYLKNISNIPEPNISFNNFFEHKYFRDSSNLNNLILNFNYTNTLHNLYGNILGNFQIENVHGNLSSSDDDSIIFGYDINPKDFSQFLNEKKNQLFFKNIKSEIYKVYDNFENLTSFLNEDDNFNVFIIGHSCSLSDTQMLQSVFTNESLYKVKILYYKEIENFKKQRFNIDKIINNTGINIVEKVSGVNTLVKLPQFDDTDEMKSTNRIEIDKMLNSKSLSPRFGSEIR